VCLNYWCIFVMRESIEGGHSASKGARIQSF
jgi:hypothetical protein